MSRQHTDLLLEGAFEPNGAALVDGPVRRIDAPRIGDRERLPGFDWRPTIMMIVLAAVGVLAYLWLL